MQPSNQVNLKSYDNDNNILVSNMIKLPKEILNIIQGYDDNGVWLIGSLIKLIKQMPNEILFIIKSYGHVGAYDNHWRVISSLNSKSKSEIKTPKTIFTWNKIFSNCVPIEYESINH